MRAIDEKNLETLGKMRLNNIKSPEKQVIAANTRDVWVEFTSEEDYSKGFVFQLDNLTDNQIEAIFGILRVIEVIQESNKGNLLDN